MERKRNRRESIRRGLSLVEILFALLILSSMIIPFYMTMHGANLGTERIEDEILATTYAVSVLNILEDVRFSDLPVDNPATPQVEQILDVNLKDLGKALPSDLAGDTAADLDRVAGSLAPTFSVNVVIEEQKPCDPPQADPDRSRWGLMKKIIVKVTWENRLDALHQVERSVTLASLVASDREVRM